MDCELGDSHLPKEDLKMSNRYIKNSITSHGGKGNPNRDERSLHTPLRMAVISRKTRVLAKMWRN